MKLGVQGTQDDKERNRRQRRRRKLEARAAVVQPHGWIGPSSSQTTRRLDGSGAGTTRSLDHALGLFRAHYGKTARPIDWIDKSSQWLVGPRL
jgi:hypothetical protein